MRWMIIGATLAMSACCLAADRDIAVVSMERLLKAHPETAVAEAALEQQAEEFETEGKELIETLRGLKDEYDSLKDQSQSKALSDKAREEKARLAGEKMEALREQQQMIRERATLRQKQFADQRRRMMMRIRLDLRGMVEEYARKKKYTLVVDSSAVGLSGVRAVVFNTEKVDITGEMLEIVGKMKD
jgi:Skp family chaperone for outer membrane proteins